MSTNQSPWPAASGFSMMLQNPRMAFKSDELKSCNVEKNAIGQPIVRSGAFAGVYKATLATGRNLCLRVFTRRAEDRRERYAAIYEHLKARKLRCLVGFEYLDGAIRHSDSKWYPLITMEWVEGNVLFDWLRERCERNDAAALGKIHRQWADVIAELADAGIAHGDLQHNNVMVTHGGEIKLVDYDGMVVPKLVGWDQLEWGVDPYQHPDRQMPETKLFTGLDNFSAIFIYVALGALAAEPVLWKQFIEPPGGEVNDKLLFKREDFEAPDQSQLIGRLRNSPDATVRKFVEHLLRVRRGSIADVPPLSGLLFDFNALRGLVQKLDWDAACQMLDESPGASIPKDLEATLRDARARVKLRKELHGAVEDGDEQAMARLSDNTLLKTNYPGVKDLLATASLARQVMPALSALDAAARDRKWRDYVRLWDQHARVLSLRMSAMLHAAEVDQARQRNAACDHLLRLVAQPAPEVDALTAAWTALRKLGGHPEADAARSRVEGLVDVRKSIEKLLRIPDVANEDNDRDLVDGWDDARFGNQPEATDLRRRAQDAQSRLLLVDAVRKLAIRAKGAPGLTADENTLLAIQKPELKGYRFRDDLLTVLKQMVARVASVRDWRTLLGHSNATEAEIGAAWNKLVQARSDGYLTTADRQRGTDALRRIPLLIQLASLPRSGASNTSRDEQLLKIWDGTLLDACAEASTWKGRHALAIERKKRLPELVQAVERGADLEVWRLHEMDCFREFDLGGELSERIAKCRARVREAKELSAVLRTGDKERFVSLFNQQVVKDFPDEFKQFHPVLTEWVRTEILPQRKIGLDHPRAQEAISPGRGGNDRVVLRWNWPPQRFSTDCLIGLCRSAPGRDALPDEATTTSRRRIQRSQWEAADACMPLNLRSTDGRIVAVWAEVDLGFKTLFSEPLILGRVP